MFGILHRVIVTHSDGRSLRKAAETEYLNKLRLVLATVARDSVVRAAVV